MPSICLINFIYIRLDNSKINKLIKRNKNNIKSIVIPVFGGACGCVEPEITSKRLKDAYIQILNNIGVKYRF